MLEDSASPRRLIVTADDMGLCEAWDTAIVRACNRGVVTSTSIATTGRFYASAARTVHREAIDHGIHLDLLDGLPLSPRAEIASLVDGRGRFRPLTTLLLLFASGRIRIDDVEREWSRQIERALGDGLRPTHLNAHYHLHLLPGIFGIAVRLAKRFGIAWVRMPDESPWLGLGLGVSGSRPTHVAKTAVLWTLSRAQRHAAGRAAVGHVDCRGVAPGAHGWQSALRAIRGEVTELYCHPGQSAGEMEALMSQDLRRDIDGRFRRTSFRELHGPS